MFLCHTSKLKFNVLGLVFFPKIFNILFINKVFYIIVTEYQNVFSTLSEKDDSVLTKGGE